MTLPLAAMAFMLLVLGCSEKKQSATAQLARAHQLVGEDRPAEALAAVNDAMKVDGRNKEAHLLAAEISESMCDLKTAVAEYARADLLDPNDLRSRMKVIDILIAANLPDAATVRINAALGDHPDSVEALARRALIESRQGNAIKARVDASAVLASAPGHAIANAVLGDLWLRDKRFDLALANVEQGLAAHPAEPSLLRLRAGVFLTQGAPDKAIASLRTLLQAQPRSTADRLALAEIQVAAGSVDDGERTMRDGVAAAPASKPMRLQLASYLLRHRNAGAAEAELRGAIATAPADNAYDLALSEVLVADGRLDAAVAALTAASARLTGAAKLGADIGLARVMATQNKVEPARALLDAVIKADPANDDALMLRAALLLRLRETEAAIADLLAVTGRKPASAEPFVQLANAYSQGGKVDDAVDALKRVADLNPADPQAAIRLADFCRQAGRSECVQHAVGDFVAGNPRSVEGRIAAIRLALAGKDWSGTENGLAALRRLPASADIATGLEAELREAQARFGDAAAGFERLIGGWGARPFDRRAADSFVRTSLKANRGPAAVEVLAKLARGETAAAVPVSLTLSALYQKLGRDADALATADSAIRAAPSDPAGYLVKASLLRQARQNDEAAGALNAGVAAGAAPEPLLMARAELERSKGQIEAAIETYRQTLKSEPRSVAAANNLVSLLADQKPLAGGRLAEARDLLDKLPYGNNPAILDTIAWADYRLGAYASAKALLLRAQADTIELPQLRFHLGAVMIALGEKDSGQALIKTVLNKNFPGRAEAQALAID